MRYFFYGTMMDRAMLSRVLRRPIGEREFAVARLVGWRRSGVRGEAFPIVLRRRGASVAGRLLDRLGAADEARLVAYEGDDGYGVAAGFALCGGRRRAVRFFVARPGAYTPTNQEWDFAAWRRRRRIG